MPPEPRPTEPPQENEFARLLRHWRRARGLSQLELASRAGVSTRHLSFLETGRCGPGRAAILELGRALELPRAETERLLLVAGHSGDWTARSADAATVRDQLRQVSRLLDAHDPLPALMSNPQWRVAWHNRGAAAFFSRLRERVAGLGAAPVDLAALLADRERLATVITNLDELLQGVLDGLYQLEPDPARFGHARALLEVLPGGERGAEAVERAARASLWTHPLVVHDFGEDHALELFSLPFAGAASGFALVLIRPAAGGSETRARAYFARLLRGGKRRRVARSEPQASGVEREIR